MRGFEAGLDDEIPASREHCVVRILEKNVTENDNQSRLDWLRRRLDSEFNQDLTYIWQLQTPTLSVCSIDGLSQIKIDLDYGDNVEDEWYLAWVVMEYTRVHTNSIADMEDLDDGQFLLIEAAYHLPKWLEGEISINRVWVHDGLVHIIPPPQTPAQLTYIPLKMTPQKAVEVVLDTAVTTVASRGVQKSVRERVQGYPDKVCCLDDRVIDSSLIGELMSHTCQLYMSDVIYTTPRVILTCMAC